MPNYFENNVSKTCILMSFETIQNCREKYENNVSLACTVMVYETIWNSAADFLLQTISLKHAFWQLWKRFGTAEIFFNIMSVMHALWRLTVVEMVWNCKKHFENNISKACIVAGFETIWNWRKINENKDGKLCLVAIFEMIWNFREIKMKTKTVNGAFYQYFKRFGTSMSRPVLRVPLWSSFFIAFLTF